MAEKNGDVEIATIEDALGLVRADEHGAKGARPDVPTSQPVTPDGEALAVVVAPLAGLVEPVAPSAGLKRRVLASIAAATRLEGMRERLGALTGLDDAALTELLRAAEDPAGPGWTDGPGPGIRWYLFRAGAARDSAPSALVFCEPGVTFPEHDHTGHEWALVLDGGAHDSSGGEWSLGDVVEYDANTRHSFTTGDAPLLAAVVAERGVVLPGR